MVRLGQRGVSDIVVVAFMFILMVLSAALLHGFSTGALEAAGDRQRELKAQHLHRTLERATVEPYAVPALEAAAQHLVLEDPEVPENYLEGWLDNTFDFLLSESFGVELDLVYGENNWNYTYYPPGTEGSKVEENFLQESSLSVVTASGEVLSGEVELRMFELA